MAPALVDGFDFAEAWADRFKVIVPYHPGFGESDDDPSYTDMHDYVMHYLELFDVLRLDRFNLVGLSLGGYLAAKFASEHGHRVKKLGLIAPAGMIDPKNPMLDILAVPGEQVPGLLVSDFDVIKRLLPEKPDLNFMGDRYREATTVARLFWERPGDPEVHALPASHQDADHDRVGRRGQDHPRPADGDLAQIHPERRHPSFQGRGSFGPPRKTRSGGGARQVLELMFRSG